MSATPVPKTSQPGLIRDLFAQLRVHQWVKNVLVFVSPLAAHVLFDPVVLVQTIVVFAAFCASASGVYVVNDLMDLQADRDHPRKRDRPFASGRLPLSVGVIGPLLMLAGIAGSLYVSVATTAVVTTYIVVSVAYSKYLKTSRWSMCSCSACFTRCAFSPEKSPLTSSHPSGCCRSQGSCSCRWRS